MTHPGFSSATTAGHEPSHQTAEQPALAREQAEALHDEIERLPGSFESPSPA